MVGPFAQCQLECTKHDQEGKGHQNEYECKSLGRLLITAFVRARLLRYGSNHCNQTNETQTRSRGTDVPNLACDFANHFWP